MAAAKKKAGLSQQELNALMSKATKVPVERLELFQKGEAVPTLAELNAVSKHFELDLGEFLVEIMGIPKKVAAEAMKLPK